MYAKKNLGRNSEDFFTVGRSQLPPDLNKIFYLIYIII